MKDTPDSPRVAILEVLNAFDNLTTPFFDLCWQHLSPLLGELPTDRVESHLPKSPAGFLVESPCSSLRLFNLNV